jgi:hypothetical protein
LDLGFHGEKPVTNSWDMAWGIVCMKQFGDLCNKEICDVFRSPRIVKSGRKMCGIASEDGDAECIHSFDEEAAT